MEQFIGCDAHKKFSVFVAVNEKGQASEAMRVPHDRELYREFLARLPPRSTIALEPGASSWTEAESRSNFTVVSRLVTPGNPDKSPLLLHPLAADAGGDAMHTGGKFWTSKDNPDWQTLATWIRTASPSAGTSTVPAVELDYAFFRDRVQPIFLAKRPGHARCLVCHDNGTPRLRELSPGASTWNEEQSRKNFEAWKRVVVPGDPLASRLLMHPLAVEAGGDPFHAGGKHWKSQNDTEWQILAAWARGEKEGGSK